MNAFLSFILFFICVENASSQIDNTENPTINLRASVLLFPTTPLLTVEVRTIGNFTLQFESNFADTHGMNIKYFLHEKMKESYVFSGIAFVEHQLLRTDGKITFLPYLGYGYAYRFGNKNRWTFDNRIGIGPTLNANTNRIYPVLKTGIGRIF